MKTVRRIFAVIIGFVFTIAGLLKLMDPTGTGLIVEEYFKFFGLRFMIPASRICGTVMALVEALVGCALITGVLRRISGIISGILIGIFTIITFILWLKNPEMECGCFGEAIHLTHLQTFVKNLILAVFWAIAFLPLRNVGQCPRIKHVSFSIAAISLLLFTLYSTLSIPMMDFTPFRPGTELGLDQASDKDAPVLSFSDAGGEYCDSLLEKGAVMVISVYDPDKISQEAVEGMAGLVATAYGSGVTPLVLVAGTAESLDAMGAGPIMMTCSYFADRRTLMTLNRSNGGATLIRDGQITAKWARRSLPDRDAIVPLLEADPTEAMIDSSTPGRLRMQGFMLYIFAVMLLL